MVEKVNITKRIVDALPFSNGSQVIYWDKALPGFGVRIGAKRKTYIVQKKLNGRDRKITLGAHGVITPERARDLALKTLGEMTQGVDPTERKREARAKSVTLAEVYRDFKVDRPSLKPRTYRDIDYAMKSYFADWQDKPITEITKDMIARRHKQIGDSTSGQAQANQAMRYLRSLFSFASGKYADKRGRSILPENPVKTLSQLRAWYRSTRRQTIIKAHELPGLFDAIDRLDESPLKGPNLDTVRDYVLFLLFTGLRKNEGASLKWDDVDFKAKTFTAPDTKNRQPLTLPLPDFVFDLLERRHANKTGDYVFPSPDGTRPLPDPKRQVERIKKESGLSFCLHDLRRSFITIAESLDVSHFALKRIVNHSLAGSDVTGGYIVHDVERLRAPMQLICDRILQLAGRRNVADVIPIHRKATLGSAS